jgi:hypothetical protein
LKNEDKFYSWIIDVKKRRESTAEQYKDAIKTITKKLKEKREINKDIYSIEESNINSQKN